MKPFAVPAGRPYLSTERDVPFEVAVFGAGAIGCWVGGRLAAGGAKVTLIGRPRVLDELAGGLTVTDLEGDRFTVKVTTSTEPSAAAGARIVLVTVKSAQTEDAGKALAPFVKDPAAFVVSLQNGVRNVATLRAALGRDVLAGMVPWNVVRRAPATYHRGSSGTLMVEHSSRAGELYHALGCGGLGFETREDMDAVQWAKLVMNLNNAINALSGLPLREELSQRGYRRVLAAAQREALSLLARKRQPVARLTPLPPRWMPRALELPDAAFRVLAKKMIAIDPHARSSMWDDFEAKRPTEIDYLQGEVVRLADWLGTTAPINRALVGLVRAAEAGGRRAFSSADLAAAVGM
ncbi:MAG: 2-dehydropantoate 2-reductase [Kofleriaceae bacterium]